MKIYKIYYAEFEKYSDDDEYSSSGIGELQGRYTCLEGATNMLQRKYLNLSKRQYVATCEVILESKTELKIKTIQKQTNKETIYHFRVVEFSMI